MSTPEYEIFAIKYGDRVGSRGTIFMHGDLHDAPLGMEYFAGVFRNAERTIVVDVVYN